MLFRERALQCYVETLYKNQIQNTCLQSTASYVTQRFKKNYFIYKVHIFLEYCHYYLHDLNKNYRH